MIAIAAYILLIVARVPEMAPSLRLAFLWLGVTVAAVIVFPPAPVASGRPRIEVVLVIALFVIGVLSTPFGLWPGGSVKHLLDVNVKLVLLFCLVAHCGRRPRDLGWLAAGLIGGIAILQVFAIREAGGERVQVTEMYDPNDIAFVMICSFPIAATVAARGRGLVRLAAGTVAVLAVPTIVLTKSRGGFLSLLLIGGWLLLRTTRGRPFTRIGVAVAACALFLAITPPEYWARIATIWGGGDEAVLEVDPTDDAALTEAQYDQQGIKAARWEIWMTGVDLMLDHPVLGVGPGAFVVGEAATHGGRGEWRPAHNSFLQLGAELGVPALLMFLALIVGGIAICRRAARQFAGSAQHEHAAWIAEGVELCLWGYMVSGFSLSQAYSPILYYLLGLCAVLRRLVDTTEAATGTAAPGPPRFSSTAEVTHR